MEEEGSREERKGMGRVGEGRSGGGERGATIATKWFTAADVDTAIQALKDLKVVLDVEVKMAMEAGDEVWRCRLTTR